VNIRVFVVSNVSILVTILLTQLVNMMFRLEGISFVVLSIILGLVSTFSVSEVSEKIAPTPLSHEEFQKAKEGMIAK